MTTEFLGSLETDVFEVAPGHYVHVEQHRSASDRSYDPGERETISWGRERRRAPRPLSASGGEGRSPQPRRRDAARAAAVVETGGS